ncbi:Uncharacterized protein Adt_36933 [Abeliophyllum distichum]|uniref:Glabrous enhancer-binding protein-like DBD domain-containing protein n=1 Tax=Abeliophyllum distichum TaxID=126358 RepID=A0ABD1QK90_9LAMI
MIFENSYDTYDPRHMEILKFMLAYGVNNVSLPEIDELHDFIKNESKFEISEEELNMKAVSLEAKFKRILDDDGEDGLPPALDKPYYREMFNLSKQIWRSKWR